MTPPVANQLSTVKRAQASRRWTALLTTAGTGLVVVALAARLGRAAAIAVAVFAAAAVIATAWRVAAEHRRWRHAFEAARTHRRPPPRDAPSPAVARRAESHRATRTPSAAHPD